MQSAELAALFARDLKRLVQEIEAFPDDQTLWQICPGIGNSAGNLALHLEGNLRDFVGRLLGHIEFARQRDLEFSSRGLTRDEILARLQPLIDMVQTVISGLTPEIMAAPYPVSNLGPMSSGQFLIHVYGHLSYHLGQIDYARRFFTGQGAITLTQLHPQP